MNRQWLASGLVAFTVLAGGCTQGQKSSESDAATPTASSADAYSAMNQAGGKNECESIERSYTRRASLEEVRKAVGFTPHTPRGVAAGNLKGYFTDVREREGGRKSKHFIAYYDSDIELQVGDWDGWITSADQWETTWRGWMVGLVVTETMVGDRKVLVCNRQSRTIEGSAPGQPIGVSIDRSGVTWWEDGLYYTLGSPDENADELLKLVATME